MPHARFACAVALLLLAAPLHADVFKPAYLQLRQVDAETYDVAWRVPALDGQTTLKVKPVFPLGTQEVASRSSFYTAGAAVQRWQVRVPGGLDGKPIVFTDLAVTGLDVLVRVERADGTEQLGRILAMQPSFELKPSPGPLEVIGTYTGLGIEHILTGFDHLLFVLALMIIVRGRRQLLLTITAFTLAHSITLALATLDIVRLPGPPVEAAIGAVDRVRRGGDPAAARGPHQPHGKQALAGRLRLRIAARAGVRRRARRGRPAAERHPARALVLQRRRGARPTDVRHRHAAAAAIAKRVLRGLDDTRWATIAAAYLIGGIASFWVVERLAAFWA
jgi:hypothetical protein